MTKATRSREQEARQKRLTQVLFGMGMVGLGVVLLLDNTHGGNLAASWWHFWPAILVVLGLPHLLIPQNDGDQAWGLFLSGAGTFLLLRNLGVVTWSFGQAWPVLLMLAGALLLVKSLRQVSHDEGPHEDQAPQGETR